MNYHLFEKALFKPTVKVNNLLALHAQKQRPAEQGYIYTLYRKDDKRLKIGFAKRHKEYELLINSNKYTMIDKKRGSEREFKLLSATLYEIGYKHNDKDKNYLYSKDLISLLSLLGWPVGLSSKSIRKKYLQDKSIN